MIILILFISFTIILLNFLIYIFNYRYRKIGKTEKGIFLFQLISLLMLTGIILFVARNLNLETFITVIFLTVSLHSIYSLSFLEIWSLSEGGYSLQILQIINNNSGVLPKKSFEILVKVGDEKKQKRIESLKKLDLVKIDEKYISLSSSGLIASNIVNFFRLLTNVKESG